MIDLRDYYLENVFEQSRYYKFLDNIKLGIHGGLPFGEDVSIVFPEVVVNINHIDEVIRIFKDYVQPQSSYSEIENLEFLLVCFYLDYNGYYITQFPRYLSNPESLDDFATNEIRNYLIADNRDVQGTVRWQERRLLIKELDFQVYNTIKTGFNKNAELTFQEISTRNSKFDDMSNQEKLKNISNYIENKLKVNNKYIEIEETIMLNLISNQFITEYRDKLHCYRHSTDKCMKERSLQQEKELFLIYLGISIIHGIEEINLERE